MTVETMDFFGAILHLLQDSLSTSGNYLGKLWSDDGNLGCKACVEEA